MGLTSHVLLTPSQENTLLQAHSPNMAGTWADQHWTHHWTNMARVLLVCVFLCFQILQCLSQEQDPSMGEYFLEAVDLVNRTRWRYFLPEDTDIDQDGNLSDLELQHKFNTYMGEVFKLIDQDMDNSISEEELRSLKLDIPHLTKAIDIALENFPLRPFFLAADGNRDGVYDENDFYMPEKKLVLVASEIETMFNISHYSNKVTPRYDVNVGVTNIGQNEGTVICKSLRYEGLEKVLRHNEMKNPENDYSVIAYTCDRTEARLEDCQQYPVSWDGSNRGMGVVCQDQQKLGALRLVAGKDSSSGDIFLGDKGLTCNPTWGYFQSNSEVICRELGYSGVLRLTKDSAFTNAYMGEHLRMHTNFWCNGDEKRLADCPGGLSAGGRSANNSCDSGMLYGVICSTDGKTGIDQGLSDLSDWTYHSRVWEEGGRFLFIADANGDGKLTIEELATKGKELMIKILEFLDENQDGKISLEDVNLNLSIGPIQNLVSELFKDVTAGEDEFDLYNMKIAGQHMSNFWGNGLKDLDDNSDEKLNAADVFKYLRREKVMFLIPMLSHKLDKNQNGKIHRDELRQFIDEMFNQLDTDMNGAFTLEDAYSLFRENGLDCFQAGALRSYIKAFLNTIDTVARNFFVYIFHQFDIDGNGQISPMEMEELHIPCDPNFERSKFIDFNSNAKRPCWMMFDGFKIGALIRSFPDSIFSERHGIGGRDETQKETFVDKLTNRACEMLT